MIKKSLVFLDDSKLILRREGEEREDLFLFLTHGYSTTSFFFFNLIAKLTLFFVLT